MEDGRESFPGREKSRHKVPKSGGSASVKELEEGRCGKGTRNDAGEGRTSQVIQDLGAEHVGKGIMGDAKGKSEADLQHDT